MDMLFVYAAMTAIATALWAYAQPRRIRVTAAIAATLLLLSIGAHAAEAKGVLDHAKDWGLGLVALFALPAAFLAARKALVAYIGREIPNLLHALLDAGDEDDDRLVYALARWVERKAVKCGAAGDARFLVVAADLCARVKILRGQEARLADLLKAAVEAAAKAADQVADEGDAQEKPGPDAPPAA